jgi:O-acetyl-ADP-ribose deacetylase (regulator of RNase III)
MISEESGSLLNAAADALVNTVNTVGVMGKGLALQFKQAYPGNFRAYQAACRNGEVRLGQMFVYEPGTPGQPRYLVNFRPRVTGARSRDSMTSEPASRTCARSSSTGVSRPSPSRPLAAVTAV